MRSRKKEEAEVLFLMEKAMSTPKDDPLYKKMVDYVKTFYSYQGGNHTVDELYKWFFDRAKPEETINPFLLLVALGDYNKVAAIA